MPKGFDVQHDEIHARLYKEADRLGRVKVVQQELANEIGVTKFTMSRTITKMVEDKRLRRVSRNRNNRGVFVVEDPELWALAYRTDEDE